MPAIAPGGYFVLDQAPYFGAAFGLSAQGGQLILQAADAAGTSISFRTSQTYRGSDAGMAQGRYTKTDGTTDFVALTAPTLGGQNSAPAIGPVVINELMYSPNPGESEFIELRNVTGAGVSLNGWSFGAGVVFAFPDVTIPANGYAVIVGSDPVAYAATHALPQGTVLLGPFAGVLDNNGEMLELVKLGAAGGVVPVDRVEYDNALPWPTSVDGSGKSLSKIAPTAYSNDSANWSAGNAGGSPGSVNQLFDDTPPTAPANASFTVASGPAIVLSWTLSTDLQSGVSVYEIYRNGGATPVGTSATPNFSDPTVQAGVAYTYQIAARNGSNVQSQFGPILDARMVGVSSVAKVSATEIDVNFTEPVQQAAAETSSNYALAGFTILSAELQAGATRVRITLGSAALVDGQPYRLVASNINGQSLGLMVPKTDRIFTPGVTNGLVGSYYDNSDFTNLKYTRTDTFQPPITAAGGGFNFTNWLTTFGPGGGVANDTFSIRWVGKIQPQYSETYTLITKANDGVRLFINGTAVVDRWTNTSAVLTNSGTYTFVAEQQYDIIVEFYENLNSASFKVEWQSASRPNEALPPSRLYTPGTLESVRPTVTGAFASGSSWSPAFLASLGAAGLGDARGISLPLGGSAPVMPWSNVDRVSMKFSEDVNVAPTDLRINGANVAAGDIASFAYDFATFTATWTLAQPLAGGRTAISLDPTLDDLAKNLISGGTSSVAPVLSGDVDGSGGVTIDDFRSNFAAQFKGAGQPGYSPRHDVNGDGAISIVDWATIRRQIGNVLPPPSPAAAPAVIAVPRIPHLAGSVVADAVASTAARPVQTGLSATRRLASSAVDRALDGALDGGGQRSAATDGALRVLQARRGHETHVRRAADLWDVALADLSDAS
jgi:hypothetical protein